MCPLQLGKQKMKKAWEGGLEIVPDRIGKLAIMTALSSREEEDDIKKRVAERGDLKLAVTVVSGIRSDISKSFIKSLVSCATQGHVVRHKGNEIHAVIHAGLECLRGICADVAAESSLKLKIAIVSDGDWLVIAAYGESAFHPETNHERIGFGVMHI